MTVQANTLNRVTLNLEIYDIRQQLSVYTLNVSQLTDAAWRANIGGTAQRLATVLSAYLSNDVRFLGFQGRVLGVPTYPAYIGTFTTVPTGGTASPILHQGAYAWVQCIGRQAGIPKPFRSGFRLPGCPRLWIWKNQHSEEWVEIITFLLKAELSRQVIGNDPLPGVPHPVYVVPHFNKTTMQWQHMSMANLFVSGPVKTLGTRFRPND